MIDLKGGTDSVAESASQFLTRVVYSIKNTLVFVYGFVLSICSTCLLYLSSAAMNALKWLSSWRSSLIIGQTFSSSPSGS